jgi:hypothetical protein
MMLSIKNTAVLVFLCFLSVSCTKDFEEINTDPNRPKEIYPGAILGQLQYKFVNTSIGGARNFSHEIMQVTAPRSSTNNGLHRYQVTESAGMGLWTNFYDYMTDVNDLYGISEKLKENNYKAISLLYKSWAYSILTDAFGDIPYAKATQATAGNFTPEFDRQKDIYAQILKDLEMANTLLDETKALTYGGDLVYHANALVNGKSEGILKWKKFCNSLRLRLLLRLSKRDGELPVREQINQILNNAAQYPLFTSNADDAIFRYPGTYPYFNPYYNARTLDWREGTYFTGFFIDQMNQVEDPRRSVWATQVKVGNANVYQGIQSGYESHVEYVVNKNSSYQDALKTLPQLGIMMTYSELEFIKAELALQGYPTGNTPKVHYENGIAASMAQWGVALPAGFLQKSGIAFDATASQTDQLKQVMLQKYYALFFTDYQAWFDKRRTGLPELPRGPGIPAGNQFPTRMPYPAYLQSLNAENLAAASAAMGGDTSDKKVWWEK